MARDRITRGLPRDLRDLLQKALDAGWTLVRGRRHIKAFSPDESTIVTISMSASDHRALRNVRADLRRGGLDL